MKDNKNSRNFIQAQKKFLLELLSFIIELNVFKSEHVQNYTIILTDILTLDDVVSSNISFLGKIIEKLQNFGATQELAFLCNVILER